MNRQRRLLMLAYDFPPQQGVGTVRVAKFSQYLPEFGWQPQILAGPVRGSPDPALLRGLPAELLIQRVTDPLVQLLPPASAHSGPTGLASGRRAALRHRLRGLAWPDHAWAWAFSAARSAMQILQAGGVAALLSSAGPYSTALLGRWLKRRFPELVWICDLRDPWSYAEFSWMRWRGVLDRLAERACLATADRVLAVTPALARLTRELCPSAQVAYLPNGFDSADLPAYHPASAGPRLRMVYTGSMIGFQTRHALIPALLQLQEQGQLDCEIVLAGVIAPELQAQAAALVQSGQLRFSGQISYQAALELQAQAHVLVFVLGSAGQGRWSHATKLFEYLASRRHILALVPPGAAASLLAETGGATLVPPDEPGAIAAAVLQLQQAYAQQALPPGAAADRLARYERRALTAELAAILDSACGARL